MRFCELCGRHVDSDIRLVNSAVLAVVELLDEPKLATLDRRHFRIMRLRHMDAMRSVPL